LVKNFFLTPERTLRRKLQEAAMALIVEARYSKRQILQSYLNEIYLGRRGSTSVHGVGEAARYYFGKSVTALIPPSPRCWPRSSRAPTASRPTETRLRRANDGIWCSN